MRVTVLLIVICIAFSNFLKVNGNATFKNELGFEKDVDQTSTKVSYDQSSYWLRIKENEEWENLIKRPEEFEAFRATFWFCRDIIDYIETISVDEEKNAVENCLKKLQDNRRAVFEIEKFLDFLSTVKYLPNNINLLVRKMYRI